MALPNATDGFVYGEGIVRTTLHCHECRKSFIAKLNFDISGNHKIVCAHCGHIHWRKIEKGVVTDDRYDSGGFVDTVTEKFWRDDSLQMETTTVAQHIRSRFVK